MRRDKLFRILSIILFTCLVPAYVAAIPTKIRVVFNQYLPPYQFINDEGRVLGMHIDILDAIAEEKNWSITYIPKETHRECLEALDSGEADIILGTIRSWTRNYNFQETHELSSSPIAVLAFSRAAEDFNSNYDTKRFIASFEFGTASYSIMRNLSIDSFKVVGNQVRVLDLHRAGQSDLMVGVKNSLIYQIYEANWEDDYSVIHRHVGSLSYYMSVGEDDHYLRQALDDGLDKLRTSGEYDRIFGRWIINESENGSLKLLKRIVVFLIIIVSAFLIYIFFSTKLQKVLKQQVDLKTCEIRKANEKLIFQYQQLKSENELRQLIMESSHSGIILFDDEFNVKLINSGAHRLSCYDDTEEQKNVLDIEVFGAILKENLDATFFKMETELLTGIKKLKTASRGERIYRFNIHQTISRGNFDGGLITIEDVTKEENLKQEAFEAEKNKKLNHMIAGIAHEIRNPLTSISASASIIETQGDSPQFREAFAEHVPKEISRISRLIENLITFSRPVKMKVEPIDLSEVVNSSLYLVRSIINKKDIQMEISLEDRIIVHGCKDRIKQVFFNIVLNSVEAMEKKLNTRKGASRSKLQLKISTWRDDKKACLSVYDEGMGMSEEELRHCNEPFYTTKASGTGIGLSLVKEYIEDNSGEFIIESRKNEFTMIEIRFKGIDA